MTNKEDIMKEPTEQEMRGFAASNIGKRVCVTHNHTGDTKEGIVWFVTKQVLTLDFGDCVKRNIPFSSIANITPCEPSKELPPVGTQVKAISGWTDDIIEGTLESYDGSVFRVDGDEYNVDSFASVEPIGSVKADPSIEKAIDASLEDHLKGFFAERRTAPGILKEALSTMKQRGEQRGEQRDCPDGERSMESVVALFNEFTGKELTEVEGWAFMVFLKMVRSRRGEPDPDDYIDGSGYFSLMGEGAMR